MTHPTKEQQMKEIEHLRALLKHVEQLVQDKDIADKDLRPAILYFVWQGQGKSVEGR